jgi:hypothetical protein
MKREEEETFKLQPVGRCCFNRGLAGEARWCFKDKWRALVGVDTDSASNRTTGQWNGKVKVLALCQKPVAAYLGPLPVSVCFAGGGGREGKGCVVTQASK